MAPPKTRSTRATTSGLGGGAALLNIHQAQAPHDQNMPFGNAAAVAAKKAAKRKADPSSPVRQDKAKRSALGTLTTNQMVNQILGQATATQNAKDNALKMFNGLDVGGQNAATVHLQQMVQKNLLKQQHQQQYQQQQFTANTNANAVANAENICGSVLHTNSKQQQMLAQQQQQLCQAAPRPTKVLTRAAARATLPGDTNLKPPAVAHAKKTAVLQQQQNNLQVPRDNFAGGAGASAADQLLDAPAPKPRRRISNEFERAKPTQAQVAQALPASANDTDADDNSLYMSALESCDSDRLSMLLSETTSTLHGQQKRRSTRHQPAQQVPSSLNSSACSTYSGSSATTLALGDLNIDGCDDDPQQQPFDQIVQRRCPPGVVDFDKENWDDPFQASHYAMDIFNYLKTREPQFAVDDYIVRQQHISKWMRSLLVDWMVEVQETFELNHETLYLAVKVVDLYLARVVVVKDKLQLLGAAAMFLACKYDERTPPLIDDFLYICDGAYVQKELIVMEMEVFRQIGYDLGMPLSYRFLRRYARCAKVPMAILTLARFILEFSLMDYATVTRSESKLAAAALFMALRMSRSGEWDATLRYYTGYELHEITTIVLLLNSNLHQKPRDVIKTVRNKYSHKIFFEVAKIPLMTAAMLFAGTGIMYERLAP